MDDYPLLISPREIDFDHVRRDIRYISRIVLRNTSNKTVRFRVKPPSTASSFSLLYKGDDVRKICNPTISLSPGLCSEYDVAFVLNDKNDESKTTDLMNSELFSWDNLQVKVEDGRIVDVLLKANHSSLNVEISPSLCDFGKIVLNSRVSRAVEIRNLNDYENTFAISLVLPDRKSSDVDSEAITIAPKCGLIRPDECIPVIVEIIGRESGPLRRLLCVRVQDKQASIKPVHSVEKIIDLSAVVMEHTIDLLVPNPDGKSRKWNESLRSVCFGSIFAGEGQRLNAILRNNGPKPISFCANITSNQSSMNSGHEGVCEGFKRSSTATQQAVDKNQLEKRQEIRVLPSRGVIDPFVDSPIQFVFYSQTLDFEVHKYAVQQALYQYTEQDNGIESDTATRTRTNLLVELSGARSMNAFISFQFGDNNSRGSIEDLTLEVSAKIFVPILEVSPLLSCYNFGNIECHGHGDMVLTIKNHSGLPVRLSFVKQPHFSIHPLALWLESLQSQSIILSFVPKQLGIFKKEITIDVQGGIFQLNFPTQGQSISPKKPDTFHTKTKESIIPGRSHAHLRNVKPSYKFIHSEDLLEGTIRNEPPSHHLPFRKLVAAENLASITQESNQKSHLTYSVKEFVQRADHREHYQTYLVHSRLERNRKKKSVHHNSLDEGDNIDLGMMPQGGMKPPDFHVPRFIEELDSFLNKSAKARSNQQKAIEGWNKATTSFDEQKFIIKKYKSTPTTAAEIKECEQTLDSEQLDRIISGPNVISFGKVSVNTSSKRALTVVNELQQHVQVTLQLGLSKPSGHDKSGDLVVRSNLDSQVIPPHAVAGFDLIYSSSGEQLMQKSITYTINGKHTRQLSIMAEVVPIDVIATPCNLHFEFATDDINRTLEQSVLLENLSDSQASFAWHHVQTTLVENPIKQVNKSVVETLSKEDSIRSVPCPFEIQPSFGTLNQKESLNCMVSYSPILQAQSTFQTTFELEIVGGRRIPVLCSGSNNNTACAVTSETADFGDVQVGVKVKKSISLRNESECDSPKLDIVRNSSLVAYTSIHPALLATYLNMRVTPPIVALGERDSQEIWIEMTGVSPADKLKNLSLHIETRGGMTLRIPVLANFVVPDVKIQSDQIIQSNNIIEYGSVVAGGSAHRKIPLKNLSEVETSLLVDLTSLEFSSGPSGRRISEFRAEVQPHQLDDCSVPVLHTVPLLKEKQGFTSMYKISIPARSSISIGLRFTPLEDETNTYNMVPVHIFFTSAFQSTSSLLSKRVPFIKVFVSAKAIYPRIAFSSSIVDFDACLIPRQPVTRRCSFTKSLLIRNKDSSFLKWYIDTTALRSSKKYSNIFHMAPEKGELASLEENAIQFSFYPLEDELYHFENLSVYVGDEYYMDLELRGRGQFPQIKFSSKECSRSSEDGEYSHTLVINLPPVPLRTTSSIVFWIVNHGYGHAELSTRVATGTNSVPLELTFPKGNVLNMSLLRLPVVVSFSSNKGIAFDTEIDFLDQNGHSYKIRATGVAENSLWTNFSFFQYHSLVDSRALLLRIQNIVCKRQDSKQAELLLTQIKNLGAFAPNEVPTEGNQSKLFGFYNDPASLTNNIQLLPVEQIQARMLSCLYDNFPGIATPNRMPQESSTKVKRSSSSIHAPVAHKETFRRPEIQRLINFMNRNVFHQYEIKEFPLNLTENTKIWPDIGFFCFGPKCPSDFPITPASSIKASDGMKAWLNFHRSLVQFLRSNGAMLPNISSVDLLPFGLYMKAIDKGLIEPSLKKVGDLRLPNQVAKRGFGDSESDTSENISLGGSQRAGKWSDNECKDERTLIQWKQTSSNAWMKLMYQVFKCFVLFRLHPHQFIKTDNSSTISSNVYSNGELMILDWIQGSIGSLLGSKLQSNFLILDFNRDFRDGKILFHLLTAYFPAIGMHAEEYRCFALTEDAEYAKTTTYTSFEADTTRSNDKIVKLLQSLDLDYGLLVAGEKEFEDQRTQDNTTPQVPVISSLNGREMVLLLVHFYKHLPEYLPRATITFEGRCGELIEKYIELRNPDTTKSVAYNVRMQSIDDLNDKWGSFSEHKCGPFSISRFQLTLEPCEVLSFLVQCQSRFVRQESATLIFQPKSDVISDSSVRTVPLVFLLETSIQYRAPQRVISIEGRLYEKNHTTIEIENPFQENANFNLYVLEITPSAPVGATKSTLLQPTKKKLASAPTEFKLRSDIDIEGCLKSQPAFYLPDLSASATLIKSKTPTLKQQLLTPQSMAPAVVTLAMQSKTSAGSTSTIPSTIKLKLEFLPFQLGDCTCYLIFVDEHVGEFMIRVNASAHMPARLETIEVALEQFGGTEEGAKQFYAQKIVRELIFPQRNAMLSKAIGVLFERNNTSTQCGVGLQKSRLRDSLKICEEQHHQCQHFAVDFDSPLFKSVPSLTKSATPDDDNKARIVSRESKIQGKPTLARIVAPRSTRSPADCSTMSITFSIEPKCTGRISTMLFLQSSSKTAPCQGECDLRVYEIIVTVSEPSMHTILEFTTPARQKTVQEIPIRNPLTEVWHLEAKITSTSTKRMFTGPPTLIVPSKQTVMYPLTFAPQQMKTKNLTETTSILTITNKNTSQTFVFKLRGNIEAPLAQDHIVVSCAARTSVVLEISVPRVSVDEYAKGRTQLYDVDSDIPHIVGGPTISIPAHTENARYEVTFSPQLSGKYLGTITFTSVEPATSEIVWYTFEALVSRSEPRDQLELVTKVRTPIGVDITLANPLPHAVTFAVKIEHELQPKGMENRIVNNLSGDSTVTIGAIDSGVYRLVYTPLHESNPGTSDKFARGELVFENEEIGEFWYRLLMHATASEPTRLDPMRCTIGSSCSEPLILQNPSVYHDMHLQYEISNPSHFTLGKFSTAEHVMVRHHLAEKIETSASIIVPRGSQITIFVIYKPSYVAETNCTEVTFSEPGMVSDWKFLVQGNGIAIETDSFSLPPDQQAITLDQSDSVLNVFIQAHVDEPATKIVDFTNPYDEPLKIRIKLLGPILEPSLDFQLLLKRKDLTLKASESIQIPITFTPRHVCRASIRLIVNGTMLAHYQEGLSGSLKWEYIIEGVAQFSIPKPFLLSCSARNEIVEILDCRLYAAPRNFDIEKESFSVDWDIPPDTFPTVEAFENALTLHPQNSHRQTSEESSSDIPALAYQIRFNPFRPYHGNIALIITKASGGEWRYEVSITVWDPPSDDTFTLEAALNQTSSFQFRLQNIFRKSEDCVAKFDKTSSSVFSVYPEHAMLPAYGMLEHCTFVVSFTPTTYGKIQSGTLVILTNEMQWTFRVKGTFASVKSVKKSERSNEILTKHSRKLKYNGRDRDRR
uniref:Uncharacterized protein AlNc14C44G3625 n=1 Tax=Albugo laibachii Nc14 TaxID=890382 RepID=F0WA96_9STRA|nr:conserved hypothetical protein [Albugo laibachii Nc14]|eukprot:CCA18066.1 conserved hypothetical protein [Albugo laibachii Nc14]